MIAHATRIVINEGLRLLGIEYVEQMQLKNITPSDILITLQIFEGYIPSIYAAVMEWQT